MTTDIPTTLTEQGQRYGRFNGHAFITQQLKCVIRHALEARDKSLADDQQEALDMICHKIGRILSGDPDYAQLVADRLNGVER
jgi:hypothetical protein